MGPRYALDFVLPKVAFPPPLPVIKTYYVNKNSKLAIGKCLPWFKDIMYKPLWKKISGTFLKHATFWNMQHFETCNILKHACNILKHACNILKIVNF